MTWFDDEFQIIREEMADVELADPDVLFLEPEEVFDELECVCHIDESLCKVHPEDKDEIETLDKEIYN